jgi:chemotaxis protein MotB
MAKRDPKMVTIIKREEIIEGGHHGGAWKVAYADFVTAMMAFFLLMWLLNATTEAQRRGLADYFSPSASVSVQRSGTGRPLGGQSPFTEGEAISDRGTVAVMNANAPPVDEEDDGSDTLATKTVHQEAGQGSAAAGQMAAGERQGGGPMGTTGAGGTLDAVAAKRAAEAARRQEQTSFAKAAAEMRRAIASDPDLAPIARQLAIDLTPDGLRVQIRDSEGLPMFANGSPEPNERAQAVLKRLAPMLMGLHEPVAIAGYTDATPYAGGAGRTNWDLSADRANATRRILTEAGLPDGRIRDVTGHGDRDLLLPATPDAASNRRIAILLIRSAPAARGDAAPPDAIVPPAPAAGK